MPRGLSCSGGLSGSMRPHHRVRAVRSQQRHTRPSASIAHFASPAAAPHMRLSRYPINTTKETPAEAEIVSHQLMLRAGLIRRTAAGVYSWLPLGLRTLRKVEAIVRQEMDRAGAFELLMPAVQPAELWQES